jgi:hypothetical protein
MQAQHLRNYREYAARGMEMSRLIIVAWDIPGQCDIRTMTHVINSHVRRHDTYRSWFEHTDGERFVRRTMGDPRDIAFTPTNHGEMTTLAEWHSHILATPNPLEWGSFSFTIIQRADHFTCCVAVDHVHCDAMFGALVFVEIHMLYTALVGGRVPPRLAEAGSYLDYCARQRQNASALTVNSPEVRGWVKFFEDNGGVLSQWPLPLGDVSVPCDLIGVQLLDERQTAAFESVCIAAGARFLGGVLACAALLQHELTGAETYSTIMPVHIRRTEADFMTMGWFTGLVPITVPATGSSFGDIARAAQTSFDSGGDLADVPLERVQELVPWLRGREREAPLLFYFDAGIPPLSAIVNFQVAGLNVRICDDGRVIDQLHIRVNRFENETQLIAYFPNNPVARESATRYAEALKSVFVRAAYGGYRVTAPRRNGAQLHPPALPSRSHQSPESGRWVSVRRCT